MKPSDIDPLLYRKSEYPIDTIFLRRWSARAMSGEKLKEDLLMQLFESAKWAPSGANRQEWYFLYAHRDSPEFSLFYDLLDVGNQLWCQNAAVLLVVLAQKITDEGKPIRLHAFDAGCAFQNLALQATYLGLIVHPMAGFDVAKSRQNLKIPSKFEILIMAAVGHPGEISFLPTHQQERELPSQRKPVEEIIHAGPFM